MGHAFDTVCDSFYVNVRVGTQMSLPHQRETLLHFFERMQRAYPGMTRFRKSEPSEYVIEEDREQDEHRWTSVEPARLTSGHVNPPDLESAMKLHRFVLEQAPHMLGLSRVEMDHIDLLLGFDLDYAGNHDEIVSECLYNDSPMSAVLSEAGAKPLDFQQSVTVALSDDLRTQAKINVITRSDASQIRTGEFGGDAISVYLIIRKYSGGRSNQPMDAMLSEMIERAEQLADKHVVPKIVRPMREAIASRS